MGAPVLDQELVFIGGLAAGGTTTQNTKAYFPDEVRGQYVEMIVYVQFSATSSAGKFQIQTAYSKDYTGTWANVGSTIDWAANTSQKYAAVTGVFGALRVNCDTAVTDGSARVFVMGAPSPH